MAKAKPQYRFGIGEWYGQEFTGLSEGDKTAFAQLQFHPGERPPCPFLGAPCWKIGGVCSLRRYERSGDTVGQAGTLRITCPSRFEEGKEVYRWIADILLGTEAIPIGQVSFLERVPTMGAAEDAVSTEGEGVGRIDNVLIVPDTSPLQWCPVEIQAVYFSGDSMERDFKSILDAPAGIPFPAGRRRPDYRSSGPKRLMPQLQIKVPTLRRWGKKMAVVVHEDFLSNMGRMETVNDLSNADVVWFVVTFDESDGVPHLARGPVYFTQLEAAVEGLISGRPVQQRSFETRILEKLERLGSGPAEVPADE
jgi:hypothetical protein